MEAIILPFQNQGILSQILHQRYYIHSFSHSWIKDYRKLALQTKQKDNTSKHFHPHPLPQKNTQNFWERSPKQRRRKKREVWGNIIYRNFGQGGCQYYSNAEYISNLNNKYVLII